MLMNSLLELSTTTANRRNRVIHHTNTEVTVSSTRQGIIASGPASPISPHLWRKQTSSGCSRRHYGNDSRSGESITPPFGEFQLRCCTSMAPDGVALPADAAPATELPNIPQRTKPPLSPADLSVLTMIALEQHFPQLIQHTVRPTCPVSFITTEGISHVIHRAIKGVTD